MLDLYSRFLLVQENKFVDEYLKYRNEHDYTELDIVHDEGNVQVNKNISKTVMQSKDAVLFIHNLLKKENEEDTYLITLVSLDDNLSKEIVSLEKFNFLVEKYNLKSLLPILKQNTKDNSINIFSENFYNLSFINGKIYNVSRVYTKDIFLINNQLVCSIYNIDDFIPLDRLIQKVSLRELFKKFIFQIDSLKEAIEIYELSDNEYVIRVLTEKVTLLKGKFLGVYTKDNKHYKVFQTKDIISCIKELKND